VGSWPLALGAELFPYGAADLAPLEAYDLLLFHVAMAHYERAAAILDRFPRKPAVLMLTCDAMFIDPQGFFPGWQRPLRELLDRARLAVTETEEVGFFQAMTPTPVVYLPIPMPLEAMRAIASRRGQAPDVPPSSLDRRHSPVALLGAGFRPKKNGIATALAFGRLRSRFHPTPRAVVFAEEPQAERAAYAQWRIEGVAVRPACPQPSLWRQLARCDLVLHLDYRHTIGRLAGECAALGVPCIGTAGATMQRALFPELIVEPWDVDGAAALATRLLRDPLLRDRVVARAARAVEAYDLEPMAARFRGLLRRFVL